MNVEATRVAEAVVAPAALRPATCLHDRPWFVEVASGRAFRLVCRDCALEQPQAGVPVSR